MGWLAREGGEGWRGRAGLLAAIVLGIVAGIVVFLRADRSPGLDKARELASQRVRDAGAGVVVTGTVRLDDESDPQKVFFQERILESGRFATPVADFSRPLCFGAPGFKPVSVSLERFQDKIRKGREINIGKVVLEKARPSELVPVSGWIVLTHERDNPARLQVQATSSYPCKNSVDNKWFGGRPEQHPARFAVNPNGSFEFRAAPGPYLFSILDDAYTSWRRAETLGDAAGQNLGNIVLSRAIWMKIAYVVSDQPRFSPESLSGTMVKVGDPLYLVPESGMPELQAMPSGDSNQNVIIEASSGGRIAYLGGGVLGDFAGKDLSRARFEKRLLLKPGHFYLLDQSKALNHWLLFKTALAYKIPSR